MTIREQLEAREEEYLSPYATLSRRSRGREREEAQCDIRPVFQRDRDRILHCKSFRRLKQKTQVFLLPKGDHYRTRLTHTLEVSQNARTIAKALRLNEDLVEAIALGHDLGHTPFGHAGEKALNRVYHFSHNVQSLRVVERVEKQGRGLNLTWEVRDGILNHKTAGNPHTLEGKVLRIFLFYYGNGMLLGKEVQAEGLPDPSLLPCDEGVFSGGTAVFPCRYFPPGTGRERRMPVMLRLYREKRCSQGEETFLPGELAERGSVALLHEGREIGCGHLEFSGERQSAAKGKFFCELVF